MQQIFWHLLDSNIANDKNCTEVHAELKAPNSESLYYKLKLTHNLCAAIFFCQIICSLIIFFSEC